MLISTMHRAILPIGMLIVLFQREVREIWARTPQGGFEVLPAIPVGTKDSHQSDDVE